MLYIVTLRRLFSIQLELISAGFLNFGLLTLSSRPPWFPQCLAEPWPMPRVLSYLDPSHLLLWHPTSHVSLSGWEANPFFRNLSMSYRMSVSFTRWSEPGDSLNFPRFLVLFRPEENHLLCRRVLATTWYVENGGTPEEARRAVLDTFLVDLILFCLNIKLLSCDGI